MKTIITTCLAFFLVFGSAYAQNDSLLVSTSSTFQTPGSGSALGQILLSSNPSNRTLQILPARTGDGDVLNGYVFDVAYTNTGGSSNGFLFRSGTANRFIINETGNVGIGTVTPSYELDVNGSIGVSGSIGINPTKDYQTFGTFTSSSAIAFSDGFFETVEYLGNESLTIGSNVIRRGVGSREVIKDGDAKELAITSSGSFVFRNVLDATAGDLVGGGTYVDRFVVTRTGEVGIGTSNPDQALTVKGKIHSEEIIVDLNVPGPDYVFEEDYDLPTLSEIEAFIKANKHLPEVPSAKEMEANGISLGEMNMLLLKKIEEMTLHQIELLKRIEKLEEEK